MRGGLRLALLLFVAWFASATRAADVPNIAVAANLNFAMPEIATAFKRASGREVKLAFGASGNFSRQIRAGAPFEMFVSADEANVRAVVEDGKAIDAGLIYAIGRLALFAPTGSAVKVDEDMRGLADALRAGSVRRLAIANPELAPYGKAAVEALQAKALWPLAQDKLVLGENVNQAAQFALSGSVQAALLPYSIVLAPNFTGKGASVVLPAALHAPIAQRMVLVRGAGDTARMLYHFMQAPEARAILERYGFTVPK